MPTADSLAYLASKASAAAANEVASRQRANALLNDRPTAFMSQGVDPGANVKFNMDAVGGSPVAGEATTQPKPIVGAAYSLKSDPVYIAAMNAGQSQFNTARANALYSKIGTEADVAQQRKNLDVNATEARRRTAGNYAARGMMGGAAGAFSLAQAEANARQQSAQTSLADQISALNKNYLASYGNENQTDAAGNKNFDWTSTLVGQNYKTQAAQNALTAQLARMGIQ